MSIWFDIFRSKTIKTCVRSMYKTARFLDTLQKDVTDRDPDVVFFGDSVARSRNDRLGDTLLTHIFHGCSGCVMSFDRAASTLALNRIIIAHLSKHTAKNELQWSLLTFVPLPIHGRIFKNFKWPILRLSMIGEQAIKVLAQVFQILSYLDGSKIGKTLFRIKRMVKLRWMGMKQQTMHLYRSRSIKK